MDVKTVSHIENTIYLTSCYAISTVRSMNNMNCIHLFRIAEIFVACITRIMGQST